MAKDNETELLMYETLLHDYLLQVKKIREIIQGLKKRG
jgi:hypothetical protein